MPGDNPVIPEDGHTEHTVPSELVEDEEFPKRLFEDVTEYPYPPSQPPGETQKRLIRNRKVALASLFIQVIQKNIQISHSNYGPNYKRIASKISDYRYLGRSSSAGHG